MLSMNLWKRWKTMPKPHSLYEIQNAALMKFGTDLGYVQSYNRMYIRKKGKFIPTGYELNFFSNKFDEKTRKWSTIKTIRFASDSELEI